MKKIAALIMICLCLVGLFGCKQLIPNGEPNSLVGCWIITQEDGQCIFAVQFFENGIAVTYQQTERELKKEMMQYFMEDGQLVMYEQDFDVWVYDVEFSNNTLQLNGLTLQYTNKSFGELFS